MRRRPPPRRELEYFAYSADETSSTDPFASAQAPAATTTGNSALGRVPAAAGAAVMGVLAAALIL
jgi:hypothetical protein